MINFPQIQWKTLKDGCTTFQDESFFAARWFGWLHSECYFCSHILCLGLLKIIFIYIYNYIYLLLQLWFVLCGNSHDGSSQNLQNDVIFFAFGGWLRWGFSKQTMTLSWLHQWSRFASQDWRASQPSHLRSLRTDGWRCAPCQSRYGNRWSSRQCDVSTQRSCCESRTSCIEMGKDLAWTSFHGYLASYMKDIEPSKKSNRMGGKLLGLGLWTTIF